MADCVLSIDPGAHSGIAVVELSRRTRLLHFQAVRFRQKEGPSPSKIVLEIVDEFAPAEAVIEDQYLDKNADSLKKLSWNVGRWQEACAAAHLPWQMIFAKTWQSALFGSRLRRDALKASSVALAKAETKQALSPDVADAYCIGRYWAVTLFHRRFPR